MITSVNNGYARQGGFANTPSPLKFQEIVVLAMDQSPSMNKDFLAGDRTMTRLEALREAATFWVSQTAAANRLIQVALVGFATQARLYQDWLPLSELEQVLATIRCVGAREPGGRTNLAGGLELALERLQAFQTHPATRRFQKILLATDGAGNIDRHKHEPLIARAQTAGVRVFPIAINNRGDDPASYDRDLLARIADLTGGKFSSAQSFGKLKAALAAAY